MPGDSERVTFAIYTSPELKDKWTDEADELNANYSEYGRMMIESGRKEMGLSSHPDQPTEQTTDAQEAHIPELENRVITALEEDDGTEFDEIVNDVVDEIVAPMIEETLNDLDRVSYRPRSAGGYILEE